MTTNQHKEIDMQRLTDRTNLKRIIAIAQSHQAKLDVALGKSPRKSSKTYIQEYALAYAQAKILDNVQ